MKFDSVSLYHQIVDIIVSQLGVEKEQCHLDANLEEQLGADSLDLCELELELDTQLNLCLPNNFCEDAETVWGLVYEIGQKIGLEVDGVCIEKAIAVKVPLKPSESTSDKTLPSTNMIASTVGNNALEELSQPLNETYTLQQLSALSKEHKLLIQFYDGVVSVMHQEIDYVIKDEKELTKFIDTVKVLEEFKQAN